MGILSGILGRGSEESVEKLTAELQPILIQGEVIERGFVIIRDKFIFTSHRIITIDVQGLTGAKKEFRTITYKSISQFSVETKGSFDGDSEFKIWISANPLPVYSKNLSKEVDVISLQKLLAQHCCA